jgi:hypothetical protein
MIRNKKPTTKNIGKSTATPWMVGLCVLFFAATVLVSPEWVSTDAGMTIQTIASFFNPYLQMDSIRAAKNPSLYTAVHTLSAVFAPIFFLVAKLNSKPPPPPETIPLLASIVFLLFIALYPSIFPPSPGRQGKFFGLIYGGGVFPIFFGLGISISIAMILAALTILARKIIK